MVRCVRRGGSQKGRKAVLFDDFRDQIQPILGQGSGLLVGVALVALADFIVPQAQGKISLPGSNRMRQRFDAGGIDGLHLLDQRENAVEFVERIGRLLIVKVKLRQFGQARNIGEGQGHEGGRRPAYQGQ